VIIFVLCVIGGMIGCPYYKVWKKELDGKAKLKKANWDRQILIRESEAKKRAAVNLGAAEITMAKARRKVIEEIGEALKHNPGFLRYLWIQGLQDGSSEVIYVPTEANIPIMEAMRLRDRKPPASK